VERLPFQVVTITILLQAMEHLHLLLISLAMYYALLVVAVHHLVDQAQAVCFILQRNHSQLQAVLRLLLLAQAVHLEVQQQMTMALKDQALHSQV
jgi:hypothetical protein